MRYILLFLSAFAFGQNPSVDFLTVRATLQVNPVKRNVIGKCEYVFDVKNKVDTIYIDAQKIEFTDVKINGYNVKSGNNNRQMLLYDGFRKGKNTLTFGYEAFPTQAMYFVNWDFTKEIDTPEEVQGQIWTQGQGKNTSHWLPSFDDVNEKVLFGLDITFHKSFEVISNGILSKKIPAGDDIIWKYQMTQPMSSYLLMLAIGHFNKIEDRSLSGIPLEMYYEREDSLKTEPTYRHSTKIFDFFETEIGVPYPWGVYRQVPVRDFLYAGMENTSATIFSRDFVVDNTAYIDRNYFNVNAHELAHQWFGDVVTAKTGKDHWLQEGFATYYALLAERHVFGDNYFFLKLYQNAQKIREASKTDTAPILDPKASSLTFYQKGAWALYALQEAVGVEKFRIAVQNYLTKFAFKNVTTADFLGEIKLVSDFDTNAFSKKWLEVSVFPEDDVMSLLNKNEFMARYIALQKTPLNLANDKTQILEILRSDDHFSLKELLVHQNIAAPFEEKEYLLSAALKTNEPHVRQAVAATLADIPESFRLQYETLLNDKSYQTQELALFNLWKEFPEHKARYLEMSNEWVGFQDRNLKLMHLSLVLATEMDQKKKLKAYLEMLSYTGTNYDSNVQQNALEKLLNLEIYTQEVFKGLVYGTGSHRWQFVKFSKDNIRQLLKEKKYRDIFVAMRPKLPIREKTQLQRLLEE